MVSEAQQEDCGKGHSHIYQVVWFKLQYFKPIVVSVTSIVKDP